jgi:hypothetical protein
VNSLTFRMGDGACESVDGTPAGRYHLYDIRLRSQAGIGNDSWNNDGTPYEVNLAHTVPERAVQLDPIQVVRPVRDQLGCGARQCLAASGRPGPAAAELNLSECETRAGSSR